MPSIPRPGLLALALLLGGCNAFDAPNHSDVDVARPGFPGVAPSSFGPTPAGAPGRGGSPAMPLPPLHPEPEPEPEPQVDPVPTDLDAGTDDAGAN